MQCSELLYWNWNKIVGEEAKRVFDDAQRMLKEMIADNLLQANGIVGFYPCNSRDDDIIIYSPDQGINSEPIGVFHGLRQQVL